MMVCRRRDMHTGEMPYDMRVVSLPAFAVERPESLDELELRLAADKPELLCIGPVKYMMDAPTDGQAPGASEAYRKLAALVKGWNSQSMAVVLEHHHTKTRDVVRGTGGLKESLTSVVHLKRAKPHGTIRIEASKTRSIREWHSLPQLVQDETGRWIEKNGAAPKAVSGDPAPSTDQGTESVDERREIVASYVSDNPEEASNMTKLADTLSIDRGTLYRDRAALNKAGQWPEEG